MRTPLIATLLIVALTTGSPAAAAPVSVTRDDQREVMVTIYNGNLGLVKDVRETRLPSGTTEVFAVRKRGGRSRRVNVLTGSNREARR